MRFKIKRTGWYKKFCFLPRRVMFDIVWLEWIEVLKDDRMQVLDYRIAEICGACKGNGHTGKPPVQCCICGGKGAK